MDKPNSFRAEMLSKARTAGDGMESADSVVENKSKPEYKRNMSINSTDSLLPTRLIQLYPSKIVTSEKKTSHIYTKNTKFVPYEPYPGAVKPITSRTLSKSTKKSRNNMDINTLISQMSQMDTNLNEYKPRPKLASLSDKSTTDIEKNDTDNDLKKKLEDAQKENETLKEQLKQQVQVNKELKTMLVASMGEDLEIQVQSLNEDKKHLANALINSAQHLSTHQEQTEWLAGQCEVWRSKFLASSLMVEELANCKKLLNEKTVNLQQAIKKLLDERCRTRDMMLSTYRNLYSLHEKWLENIAISDYISNTKIYSRPIGNLNFTATLPHSTNILDMASVNLKLSENISSSVDKQDISHFNILPSATEAEIYAENVMAMPLEVKKANEDPVNALVNHAYNNSTNVAPPVASCVHCNGRVQLL
ncbi:PREDICTED: golgin-45 [Papilio xuthus]|uniref:Golgin-45 n=1 Tax=Papilio xuthus TaxID=66420 RepID=A0A194Q357_PAPXU|nr:PREDICTED: golgin-45 [Papilio xuthus]KPI99971.1 Golgin-45 [Papilio xuthus]